MTTQPQQSQSDLVPLHTAVRLLVAAADVGHKSMQPAWPRWAKLLPHVLAALDRVSGDDSAIAVETAWLSDKARTYRRVQTRLQQAWELIEHALIIDETSHPDVAAHLDNLVGILHELGDAAAARPLAERALAIAEANYGPDHPDIAIPLGNLGLILLDLGESAAARALIERALAIAKTTSPPANPIPTDILTDLVTTRDELIVVLLDNGMFAAARPVIESALDLDDTSHGPKPPDEYISAANELLRAAKLASAAQESDHPDIARTTIDRALEFAQHVQESDSPDVAIRLGFFALILRDLGEPARALPVLERAFAISEFRLGPDHPATVTLGRWLESWPR